MRAASCHWQQGGRESYARRAEYTPEDDTAAENVCNASRRPEEDGTAERGKKKKKRTLNRG